MNQMAATTFADKSQSRWMALLIAIVAVALVVAGYANTLVLALTAGVVVLALAFVRFKPLLLAVVFFLPVAPFLSWNLPIKDLGTLLRVCLFAGALASRVRRGESIRGWLFSGKLTWAMLAYFSVAIASGVAFNPPTPSVARELMRLASYLCFYYVISDWVRTDEDLAGVVKVLMISTLCVAAFGFYQVFVGDYSALFDALYPIQDDVLKNPPWSGRITSFLSHYNGLAGYLNLVIPFCIGFALRGRDVFLRRLSLVCFILSSVALLLTQSRGGLVTYVAILLLSAYFLAPSRKRRLQWTAAILTVSIAAGFVAGLVFERLSEVDNYTEITRLAIWAGAAGVFAGAPLAGIGYGNLREHLGGVIGLEEGRVLDAHNLYLQLLAETGIIGFVAFAVLVIVALRLARRVQQASGGQQDMTWIIGFAAFAGTAGVLIHGMVDYMFHASPQFAALFFLVLGLLNVAGLRSKLSAEEIG
jgi:O-antigen ligase